MSPLCFTAMASTSARRVRAVRLAARRSRLSNWRSRLAAAAVSCLAGPGLGGGWGGGLDPGTVGGVGMVGGGAVGGAVGGVVVGGGDGQPLTTLVTGQSARAPVARRKGASRTDEVISVATRVRDRMHQGSVACLSVLSQQIDNWQAFPASVRRGFEGCPGRAGRAEGIPRPGARSHTGIVGTELGPT